MALTQTIGHATNLRVEKPWDKIHNAPIRPALTDCTEEYPSADPEDVLSPLPASRRTRRADL